MSGVERSAAPYPPGTPVWLKVCPVPPVRAALGQDNWAPAIVHGHDRLGGRVLVATLRNSHHQRYVARDRLRPRLAGEIGPGIKRFGP